MADRRINREGRVHFNDASVTVMEEGIPREWQAAETWSRAFKRDVFLRIVQQLNRLGWKCQVPPKMVKEYSVSFARNHRHCRKGDLQGNLSVSGRCVQFEMWQDVANVENPNGGQYDFGKEARMPYVLRLEMERTRRRIQRYLCNVFTGYVFNSNHHKGRVAKKGPGGLAALDWIAGCYEESPHFKGNLSTYTIADYNRRAANGAQLHHLQQVWGFDSKGRAFTGIAYYNINNMWWVVTGKYTVRNEGSFALHTVPPDGIRVKRNAALRRKRLEQELAKAVSSMNFRRAELLRDLIWPPGEPLFMVWHREHKAFHGPNFSGYYADETRAGKFTYEEAKGWANGTNELRPLPRAEVAAHG